MNLKNLKVTLQDDGFTVIDEHHDIPDGSLINAKLLIDNNWVSKQFAFNPTPSLLEKVVTGHRHVFLYTGTPPTRVILLDPAIVPTVTDDFPTPQERQHLYRTSNYYSSSYDDDDDFLPYFLGGYLCGLPNHHQYASGFFSPGGGTTAGAGAGGAWNAPTPAPVASQGLPGSLTVPGALGVAGAVASSNEHQPSMASDIREPNAY